MKRAHGEDELPAIAACYDLLLWLAPVLDRTPRARRLTVGDRIEARLIDALGLLVASRFPAGGRGHRSHHVLMGLTVAWSRDAVRAFRMRCGHSGGSATKWAPRRVALVLRQRPSPFRRLTVPSHAKLGEGNLRALIRPPGSTVEQLVALLV